MVDGGRCLVAKQIAQGYMHVGQDSYHQTNAIKQEFFIHKSATYILSRYQVTGLMLTVCLLAFLCASLLSPKLIFSVYLNTLRKKETCV